MPAPMISIQPLPRQMRQSGAPSPLQLKQSMDMSTPGSTKGKKSQRKRTCRSAPKSSRASSYSVPFRLAKVMPSSTARPSTLREVPLVGGVRRLEAVHAPRHDDAHWRARRLHDARLHWRGVGAHQQFLVALGVGVVEPQRVEHVPRRVALGDVQHAEVVVVRLDLRPLDDLEAHAGEGAGDLTKGLGDGVEAAQRGEPARQSHVEAALRGLPRQPRRLEVLRLGGQRRLQQRLHVVGLRADGSPLLRLKRRHGAHDEGEAALSAAQVRDAPRLERLGVRHAVQLRHSDGPDVMKRPQNLRCGGHAVLHGRGAHPDVQWESEGHRAAAATVS